MIFTFIAPLRTVSLANAREHWAVRAKRAKTERLVVRAEMQNCPEMGDGPLVVSMTRMGKRLLDDDNLAGSFKAIRDEIAACLGRDDAPGSGIRWEYEQRKSKEYGICVQITT